MAKRSKPFVVISENRKNRMMELVCSGKNLTEVAKSFGVTQGRISQVVSEKRAEWAARNEIIVGDHVAVELARLDRIIEQADRTYQRSLKDAHKVVTSRSEMGESQTETVEGQSGDMAALGIKLKAVEMKLKLLNAFPKEERNTNVVLQQFDFSSFMKPIPCDVPLEGSPAQVVEKMIADELASVPSPNNNGNGKH